MGGKVKETYGPWTKGHVVLRQKNVLLQLVANSHYKNTLGQLLI